MSYFFTFFCGYSQLIRAIKTGGLLPRIEVYKSALEGLDGSNAATVALVEERFAKVEDTIRKEYCSVVDTLH